MSMHFSEYQHPVLYQAAPDAATALKSMRDQIHHICRAYVNRLVRVQTLDGHTYEGVIVQSDGGHVYLNVSTPNARAIGGPGSFYGHHPLYSIGSYMASQAAILTLVLFELLVIVLLA